MRGTQHLASARQFDHFRIASRFLGTYPGQGTPRRHARRKPRGLGAPGLREPRDRLEGRLGRRTQRKPGNLRPVRDLTHLWQRFLLASSLVVGLLVGAAATVFGYSNLSTVDVRWSVIHITGVPLWTVAVVPLAIVLVAGTLYHWMDSLHQFTEHMRHRRRVHELEGELASLRAHLDQLLEMPDQSTSRLPRKPTTAAPLPVERTAAVALLEPAATLPENGDSRPPQTRTPRPKRAGIGPASAGAGPELATSGEHQTAAGSTLSAEGVAPADPVPEN